MNRLDKKFIQLGQVKKKALIAFITAGFPNLSISEKLVLALGNSGVDIVELGVPFSDPLADGPVIQNASLAALKNKTNLVKILSLVKRLRKKTQLPICLMSYYNPIFCFGQKQFIHQAVSAGVDGVIIPDLPCGEADEFSSYARKLGLISIRFIAPTSSPERIKKITKMAQGFIYYISLTGVTGQRNKLSADLKAKLSLIKKITTLPVCVGFGISNRQQAQAAAKIFDGVIVGSAIVSKIKENIGRRDLVDQVASFVKGLNV